MKIDLSSKDDKELIADLMTLNRSERQVALEIIPYLVEVHELKLQLMAGYTNLYDFCREVLGYDRHKAFKRAKVASTVSFFPELVPFLASGELSETQIAVMAPKLTQANFEVAVEKVKGRSKRETEFFMAAIDCEGNIINPDPMVSVTVTLKRDVLEKLERVREIMGQNRSDRGMGSLLEEIAEFYIEANDPMLKAERAEVRRVKREESKNLRSGEQLPPQKVEYARVNSPEIKMEPSRYIPAEVRHAVMARDQGCCSYVGPDGKRCGARGMLEFDHVKPFALGGNHQISNIRVVCRAHNGLAAEAIFGKKFMDEKIGVQRLK
jgi:5-methylcytosine-specific restriction endonuclease McrA